ncbi:Homeobox-leucine zipper protein ATHB-52 [Heracleum sosnowskyi]|uniref:Homeobox-leucine zipper protein n=1 Tax=Heracleum sosnowskyi TaxID=360622 RepID=A0AAD8J3G6_9APIA|nr:Homeobox-leucine zipper protein ATHB-52 [Heracleum sosnowskyi]
MMDNFKNSQNQKSYSSKSNNKKKRLTQDEVRLLEESFNGNNRLEPERKLQLARELGIPPRQIAIWYQNKRARWKNQSLELDYTAIHMRLEAALAQKRQLEKEVQRLRVELQKSQAQALPKRQVQMLQPQHPHQLVSVSSIESNCDEVGSSSLHDDQVHCSWMNDHDQAAALRVEEFYACLMGTNGSNFN